MRQHLHDQVSFTAFASLLEDLQQQSALLLATLPLHELLTEQLELLGTEQQFQRLYYGQGYSLQPVTAANIQLTRSLLNLVQDQGRSIALPSLAINHGADSVVEYLRRALLQRIVTEEQESHTPQFTQDLARELMQTWSDSSRDASDKLDGFLRRHYFALDHQDTLYATDMIPEMMELNKSYKESDNPRELRPLQQQLLHLLHSVAGAHRPASGEIPLSLVRKWYDSLGAGLTCYYFAHDVRQEGEATASSKEQTATTGKNRTAANQDAAHAVAVAAATPSKRGRKPKAASVETTASASNSTRKKASAAQTTAHNSKSPADTTYQGVNFTQLDWEQLVAGPLAARNYLPREWRNLLTPDAILSYIPADLPPLTHMVYRGMVSYYLRPQQRSVMQAPSVPRVQPAPPREVPLTARAPRKKEPAPFQPRSTAQMQARLDAQRYQGVDRTQLQRLSEQLNSLLRK